MILRTPRKRTLHWSGENIVKVPYKIDGTGFDGVVVVESYNTDTSERRTGKGSNQTREIKKSCRCGYSGDESGKCETESEKEEKESSGESERKYEVTAK